MNTIKNLHLIDEFIDDDKIEDMEDAAFQYKRHANITFKVLSIDTVHIDDKTRQDKPKQLVVEVRQDRNSTDKYLSIKELNERAKDLFGRFFPDYDIHTRPKPYQAPPVDSVDSKWVKYWMNRTNTSIKQLETETGIDRSNISAWANGNRPMSQPVKAMFYFLFTTKMNPQNVDLSDIEVE